MSRADSREDDLSVPSNAELGERTARIEQNVEHVVDTVDRIEESMTEEQAALSNQVEQNAERLAPIHLAYRFTKYAVPAIAAAAGTAAGMGVI